MLCANEFIVKVAVVATAKTPWKPDDLAAITKITRYEISRIDKKHLKIVNLKTFFSVGVGGGGGGLVLPSRNPIIVRSPRF